MFSKSQTMAAPEQPKPQCVIGEVDMLVDDESSSDAKRAAPVVPQPVQQQPAAPALKPFEIKDGKYYVAVDYLLQDQCGALTACEKLQIAPPKINLDFLTVLTSPQQQQQLLQVPPKVTPTIDQRQYQRPSVSHQQHGQPRRQHEESEESLRPAKQRKLNSFKWNAERHLRFCCIASGLGLRDCKPKHIMSYYDGAGVDKAVIGSHLQKIRNCIIKDYGLKGLEQVQNWYVPRDCQDARLDAIAAKWKQPGFSGLTSAEIQEYIKGMQRE